MIQFEIWIHNLNSFHDLGMCQSSEINNLTYLHLFLITFQYKPKFKVQICFSTWSEVPDCSSFSDVYLCSG